MQKSNSDVDRIMNYRGCVFFNLAVCVSEQCFKPDDDFTQTKASRTEPRR